MADRDKSGYTNKTTDWLGREKEEHFDSHGNKTGETRFATDWLGNAKQEHFNTDNEKIGETRKGSDWIGNERAEHVDASGKRVGYSKNTTDWLSNPIQQHYDSKGRVIGESRRVEDWLGRSRKEHRGEYFKGSPSTSSTDENRSSSSASAGPGAGGQSGGLSFVLGTIEVILLVSLCANVFWPTLSKTMGSFRQDVSVGRTEATDVGSSLTLEGRIIGNVALAPQIPQWLQELVGQRSISRDNYPPPEDFQIRDRCAGEGCFYGWHWRALKEVPLFAMWGQPDAERVYILADREVVTALTGVWIVKKPAVLEVLELVTIDGVDLHRGDLIYVLMYLGEGFVRAVFHGKLAEFSPDAPVDRIATRKLREDYEFVHWVQMKTGTGIIGWTNDPAYPSFDGQSKSAGPIPNVTVVARHEQHGLWDYEVEVYTNGKAAILGIGSASIPCPASNDVQKLHTGLIVRPNATQAIELVAADGELLAKVFVDRGTGVDDLASGSVPASTLESQPSKGLIVGVNPQTGTLERLEAPENPIRAEKDTLLLRENVTPADRVSDRFLKMEGSGSTPVPLIPSALPDALTRPTPAMSAGNPATENSSPGLVLAEKQNGRTLLRMAQDAMGGRAKLAALRDWQRRAKETWEPEKGTTESTTMFVVPSSLKEEIKGANKTKTANYSNGQSGWTWSSSHDGVTQALPNLTATGMVFRTLNTLVLSDDDPNRTVGLTASDTVVVSDRHYNSATLTVDLSSHLPTKLSWRNLDGAILEETYSHWRRISGTMWWFQMTRARNGQIFLMVQVKDYRINAGLTDQFLGGKP
jgi:hypothetical protein